MTFQKSVKYSFGFISFPKQPIKAYLCGFTLTKYKEILICKTLCILCICKIDQECLFYQIKELTCSIYLE